MTGKSARDLICALSRKAYEGGDYHRCLEFGDSLGDSIPDDLRTPLAESAYYVGKELAGAGCFVEARKRILQAYNYSTSGARKTLCQERLALMRKPPEQTEAAPIRCPYCGERSFIPKPRGLTEIALRPEVDEVYCFAAYRSGWDRQRGNPFSQMLRQAKRTDGAAELETLCGLSAHFVVVHLTADFRSRPDLIVPVRTVPSRFAERGFSIPDEIASRVGLEIAVPVFSFMIDLRRETADLRPLSKSERERELEGAYCVSQPEIVVGHTVMIVDDVITHGTTLRAIARELRKAGAEHVLAFAVARTEST